MENDCRTLCKPCAVKLSQQGKRLKPMPGKTNKITCAECGRRRYGLIYTEAPAGPPKGGKRRENK